MIVFIAITKITDATKISTWFQRKWTWISIPMLERKSAAKRLQMGSIYNKKKWTIVKFFHKPFILSSILIKNTEQLDSEICTEQS